LIRYVSKTKDGLSFIQRYVIGGDD